jgi:hypothetical protein
LQRLQRARLPPESGGRQVHAHLAGGGRGEANEGEEGVKGVGSEADVSTPLEQRERRAACAGGAGWSFESAESL